MTTIVTDTPSTVPVPTPPGVLPPVPPVPNVTKHVSNAGGQRTVFVVDRAAKTVDIQQEDGTLRTTGPTPHIEGVTKLPLLSDCPGDESLVDMLSAQMDSLNTAATARDFKTVKTQARLVGEHCDKILADAKATNATPDSDLSTDAKATKALADSKLSNTDRTASKPGRDVVVQQSPPAPPLA
jgi:hypothetical protein